MKKTSLILLLSFVLVACIDGEKNNQGGGNPNAGTGVVNYSKSRLGTAGGFIDLNGDGTEDAVAGAPEAHASDIKPGVVALYLMDADASTDEASMSLQGEGDGDFFGFSFAKLGDVDGDGKADFAIGAINAEGDAGMSGAAYVYRGGVYPPQQLLKLKGERAFDKFGFSLAGGDVNNDGINDIIVGAPYTITENYFQSGAVYVYFGSASMSGAPDIVIKGEKVQANIGTAVTTGDVNGDNVVDLIMDGHAKAYIYYGGTDIQSRINADPVPNVNIRSDSGRHGGSGFAYTLAYAGDINGDGIGDIAIANPRRSDPATYDNRGSVYIFKGFAAAVDEHVEFFEDNVNYRLVKIEGDSTDDQFGSAITMSADMSGDGTPELLVGARWANGGSDGTQLITGNTYLFHGEDLNVDDPAVALTVAAAHAAYPHDTLSSEFGTFVDVNDHIFISGAPGANQHDGAVLYKHLHDGTDVVVGGDTAAAGGSHVH